MTAGVAAMTEMTVAGEGVAAGLEDLTTRNTGSLWTMSAPVSHGRTWKISSEKQVKWHLLSAIRNVKERVLLSSPTQVIWKTLWRNWTAKTLTERGWSWPVRAWEDRGAGVAPEADRDPEATAEADLEAEAEDVVATARAEAKAKRQAEVRADLAPQLLIRSDLPHRNNGNLLQGRPPGRQDEWNEVVKTDMMWSSLV